MIYAEKIANYHTELGSLLTATTSIAFIFLSLAGVYRNQRTCEQTFNLTSWLVKALSSVEINVAQRFVSEKSTGGLQKMLTK
jgi:hypothetical protein